MTKDEIAAFGAGVRAGIRTAIDMAIVSAVTLEIRGDTRDLRRQAGAAVLQGLVAGLKAAFLEEPDPVHRAMTVIADDAADSGVVTCPECAGRLWWMRDSSNRHLHGQCETEGCLRWMQ